MQAWGQLLWCLAHTVWIGNSFMVCTSLVLCVHHAIGCLHGDFRLKREYGEAFEEVRVHCCFKRWDVSEGVSAHSRYRPMWMVSHRLTHRSD